MKLFQFTGTGEILIAERSKEGEGVKVKINRILFSPYDLNLFLGKIKTSYPVTPCSMATAIISEDTGEFKQGQKVMLNPFFYEEDSDKYKLYGKDAPGFFCDFTRLPPENVISMQDIKEEDGIFLCYVAQAIAILDSLKLEKGDYVTLIGASPVMNILAQLILYYQGIPIVISNDSLKLQKARENGVYYTINATAESPYERVMAITGGRLAESGVYSSMETTSANYMLELLQEGGKAVIMGLKESVARLELDISPIYKKGLTLSGISDYRTKIDGAVNILMQDILKLKNLCDRTADLSDMDNVAALLNQWSENTSYCCCPIVKTI
ncbi:MAG: zinc-binding dehydrogenase [Christensenellales bacterium]|jgi:L-iditol 2-dehydrogenase